MTRRLTLLVILVTLVLPSCDISPTEIVGGPRTLEGTITSGGRGPLHLVVITSSGGVRIEALSITADPPLAEGVTPSVGLSLGETDSEDLCIASFTTSFREGDNLALGLEVREYCLELFDNGTIMEDGSRSYVVQVRSSE